MYFGSCSVRKDFPNDDNRDKNKNKEISYYPILLWKRPITPPTVKSVSIETDPDRSTEEKTESIRRWEGAVILH